MNRFSKITLLIVVSITAVSGLAVGTPVSGQTVSEVTIIADTGFTLGFYHSMTGLSNAQLQAQAATAASTKSSLLKAILDTAKKVAGQAVKRYIIERYVNATIDWINSGAQGSYNHRVLVENWKTFLEDAGNSAIGDFAQSLGAGFLCSPFNLQLRLSLAQPEKFDTRASCTLDQITANIQDFAKDFSHGGWIAYNELWYPQNNYYGATLMAWDEATQEAAKAQTAAQSEAIAGQGFLSFKKCDANGVCRITTPGGLVGEAAKSALINLPANAIVNADDIASYVSAIADAAINQLIKTQINGLQREDTRSFDTSTGDTNPCVGLRGDALAACNGLRRTSVTEFNQSRSVISAQVSSALASRQDAQGILNQTIQVEEAFITKIQDLATCQQNHGSAQYAETKNLLDFETETLQTQKDKLTDNQDAISLLENTVSDLNQVDPEDWVTLSQKIAESSAATGEGAATDFLSSAQSDQTAIQSNIDSRTADIDNELQICQG